jgi:hypothetical protein
MEGERPIRWGCLVSVLVLVAGVMSFAAWVNHEAMLTAAGREYDPKEWGPGLEQELESHFRWSGLPRNSVEKVWSNGFQDHTSLYRIRLSPEQFAGLHQAVLSTKTEDVRVDDGDDPALCPLGFGTSAPQGPKDMKVPEWWEVASLRSLDGLFWKATREGYWFGYDRERGILFLLSYDT